MALTLEHKGIVYRNFTTASVGVSMRTASGFFSFETTGDKNNVLPMKAGDAVKMLADGEPVVTGFIDTLDVDYDATTHTILATGRDKTADIIDSSVIGKKEFSKGVTLPSIIRSVISDLGISDISVIDETGGVKAFTKDEVSSAEIGQSCIEFIMSFANKRQVLIVTDGKGNLVLTRGSKVPSGLSLIHTTGPLNKRNNVKSARFNVDLTQRFNFYQIRSQGNPVFSLDSTSEQLTEIQGIASDSSVRSSRKLEFQAEESFNAAESKDRAIWEANLRRVNSSRYKVIVQGHSLNNKVWRPNQLVTALDDFVDIKSSMLISDVEYEYDLVGGSTSKITLVPPDAFTLQAELDNLLSNTSTSGASFTL